MSQLFMVFIGGGLGAACRYIVTTHVGARFGTFFPFGTLLVHPVGSFLMGVVMGVLLLLVEQSNFTDEPWKMLLTVGFLGGFTTFSSFSMETLTLLRGGSYLYAVLNVLANIACGLFAVAGGMSIGHIILRG